MLVLSPDTLKESCWTPQNQLWLAHDGFGCSPTLSVGLSAVPAWAMESRQMEPHRLHRRSERGIPPRWAREKLEEFQGQNAGMGGMEMT